MDNPGGGTGVGAGVWGGGGGGWVGPSKFARWAWKYESSACRLTTWFSVNQ